jgi:hypothetical protein
MGQVGESLRRFAHGVGRRLGTDSKPVGQPEELLAVGARVRRDAAEGPLLEQRGVVVEDRDVGQPDAGDRQCATTVERAQGGRD